MNLMRDTTKGTYNKNVPRRKLQEKLLKSKIKGLKPSGNGFLIGIYRSSENKIA